MHVLGLQKIFICTDFFEFWQFASTYLAFVYNTKCVGLNFAEKLAKNHTYLCRCSRHELLCISAQYSIKILCGQNGLTKLVWVGHFQN